MRAYRSGESKISPAIEAESVEDNSAGAPVPAVTTNGDSCDMSGLSSPTTSADVTLTPVAPQPKSCRPKGSTAEKKQEELNNGQACIGNIAFAYSSEKTTRKSAKKRCEKGYLEL